jgi:hypothetical protein
MLNNDYSSIIVIDPETFEPIGTLKSNARSSMSNTRIFSMAIADIANIFSNSIIAIEKNNMGISIIDNILTDYPSIVPRLYSSEFEFSAKSNNIESYYSITDAESEKFHRNMIVYGFDTTLARRSQMMSELLGIIVNELYDLVNDNDIYIELTNIIRKNGRIDHRNGKHDDLLFAWLIGLWVLCYSKVLESKYQWPLGFCRPMSIVMKGDDSGIQKEKQKHEESFDDVLNLALKSINAQYTRNNEIKQFNPDTREYRDEEDALINPSYSDIGEYLFGDDTSLTQDVDILEKMQLIDTPIEDNIEDIDTKLKSLDRASRDDFLAERNAVMMQDIENAKSSYQKNTNIQKSRKERNKKRLENSIPELKKKEITALDSLLNAFANNWD